MSTPPPKIAISTTDAPAAIGPYSQAIRTGNVLYTSGQIPLDPRTGEFVAGGITEQTEQVIANLRAVLAAGGLTLADVVKTTVYLKHMSDFGAMNTVYARHFAPDDGVPSARTTVAVAGLPRDALVEMEAVASKG